MKQNRRNKARLAIRRETAAVRQAAHVQLTPTQKWAKLDERLGKNVGATKERARLVKLMGIEIKPVSKETAEAVFGVAEIAKLGKKSSKKPKTA